MNKKEKLKYCEDCEDDFYNGKNPYDIQECWYLEEAELIKDRLVFLSSSDIKSTKKTTLGCWRRRTGDW